VLAVLVAGLVLGAPDGFISQALLSGLIAVNLPVAAGGAGAASLTGATAGYLISFPFAAAAAGFLMERGADRVWQRWLAGAAGIAVIYLFGLPVLKFVTGADWSTAWGWGVAPFLGLDLVKAFIAAAITEGSRAGLLRMNHPTKLPGA
jgi:biotin transport system substrate-specific component